MRSCLLTLATIGVTTPTPSRINTSSRTTFVTLPEHTTWTEDGRRLLTTELHGPLSHIGLISTFCVCTSFYTSNVKARPSGPIAWILLGPLSFPALDDLAYLTTVRPSPLLRTTCYTRLKQRQIDT
ncbi:hypothetical protein VNO78_08011 [Psophocarpus tetragonolobus]|uniref:Uncharacterized protein n=1 Tax=Psophocarpus tetragonolobus TaxID=3891 RepID=A0AAN9XS76_PSOTE